ncbi:acyl-CoA dehydratase activase-related protein [Proteinivorax hydrogeniformans]|uniref:Acyl-CoA dehydratase activase-related protein n=1 Tax=Proteinivorax hydrogeniformans TaxID=1826727 RepID=A0AAU8HSL1_9FIRM
MKIGIPQGLLHWYYYPFWKVYFEQMGFEVITSSSTTKEIVDQGVKHSVPEICVPIKIFMGHVVNLLEQEVDYIFVPRFESIEKGKYFCPKFMGLPDLIRHYFDGVENKLVMPTIKTKTDNIANAKGFKEVAKQLGISRQVHNKALKKAEASWLEFRSLCKKGFLATEAMDIIFGKKERVLKGQKNITLGVLGYVYNLYDPYVSMDILTKFREMGVNVKTFEMEEETLLNQRISHMDKDLFWTFSNRLFSAGYRFYEHPEVDGIIHVTAFGCGPDAMLGKILEYESEKYKKPFMTVRIDEHSGENHLQTRVEAFVDMIIRKKDKRGA